jgi:predicted nuclease of predicted toxin-antitoxin system
MRLLIDECLPRALKRLLAEHECRTVQEMGWSGTQNGALLLLAEQGFDVLVTVDQGMEHEQNLANRKIALLVLGARSNQIEDLVPIIPAALAALRGIQPGQTVWVAD